MEYAKESNRYIQLTQQGLMRITDARRKSRKTLEEIALDRDTPSINTVKRLFRRQPIFLGTMERVWDFFQRCAHERKESFPYPIQGEDYLYVEGELKDALQAPVKKLDEIEAGSLSGWMSRQVPRQNRLFTGRREALANLHASLQTGLSKNAPDPQALAGLGGIGKTQTALAYAYEHRQDYNGVFWIRAESVEELNEGLAELAEELNLVKTATSSKYEAIRKTHEWFRNSSNWLLVLDNADDLSTLSPYFPSHHSGALLITTRCKNTVQWAASIEIVKMERESGAILLLQRAGILARNQSLQDASPESVRIAIAISEELDGLPLALDQAGAYVSETEIDLEEYLSRYCKYGISLLDEIVDADHASVRVTFGLALAQLAKRGVYGKAAKQLVQLSAFLAPDAIPEAIFASDKLLESELSSTDASDDLNAVYATACAFSLMSRVRVSKTLSIHRLAQAVVRESMTPENNDVLKKQAVLAVSAATPDFEFEDWQLCDLLLANWRVCAKYISELNLATKESVYLLFQAGRYLRTRALYEDAEIFLRRSVEMSEIVHGSSHMMTADCTDALACLYRELDRCDFAEPLHDRAIKITEAAGGPNHPELASKLHNSALLYIEKKEYLRAEIAFLRVLEIREKHPEEAQLLAASLNQLAGVYRYQALYAQAEPFYRRALELYENALHPNHIDLATGCSNLGYLFLNQGTL